MHLSEAGRGYCTVCECSRVQFLDQTVALRRLGLRWTPQGVRFRRIFLFDYNEEGPGRRTGYLIMLGQDLEEISMGLPTNPSDG